MIRDFDHLIEEVTKGPQKTVAVVSADDVDTLSVVAEAEKKGIASFILIGDEQKIRSIAKDKQLELKSQIVHQADHKAAAEEAVRLVKAGSAHTLMKGMLHSSVFLKAVLNRENGLNTGKHVTQITVMEKEGGGLLMITDCAISIAPDLKGKIEIIENAVTLAHTLGIKEPKVAVLSAVEVVNPDIPETMDAAILSKMAERGQIKGCVVDGPLAFDNAVSKEAADAKGIKSEVAGNADIILVPNLTVGNAVTKALTYIGKKPSIAATMGAAVPLVFTSRTETKQGKLLTLALALYDAGRDA